MKLKQLLSCLLLFLTSIATHAYNFEVDGIYYNSSSNNTVYVTYVDLNNNGNYYYGDIVIPQSITINGTTYAVTSIGLSAFRYCSSLTSVTIPEGVTSIGNYAFSGCSSLASVNIPQGVSSIGNYAFNGCSSLTSITIPESLTSIGSSAFSDCPCTIIVPDEIVDECKAAWPDYSSTIIGTSWNVWKEYTLTAQENESDLANQVGEANLRNVTKLRLSGTMNSYDMMILRNKMFNLHELDLRDVNIVANNYEHYTGFHSEDDVLGGHFLEGSRIVSVVLPSSITSIDISAFKNSYLNSISNLHDNIVSIGNEAFQATKIKSITIPAGVTTIKGYTFYDCKRLEEVWLSPLTTTIDGWAFYRCSNLKTFHLPPYLTTIGGNAFLHTPLESVYAYMPDVPAISVSSFDTYKTAALYVPNFLYRSYYYDTNWSQFLSVNRCELNPGDYEKLRTQSDVTILHDEDIIPDIEPGNPIDGEVVGGGSITVGSDDPQNFDEMEQEVGQNQSGSLIADGGDGDSNNNMPTNTLKVKIQVSANRWYFFCFPFDVTITECEYPGQYVWREYDGLLRAMQGANGWKDVAGTTLTARQGYIFQSSTAGTLVVKFNNPTFGGNRPRTLVEYLCDNAANASWNFVGNPYSCFYDFQEDDFSSPITVWNGTSYQAYRPGDDDYHLQPYEAFFVQKPTDTQQICFNKERRETYTQSREKMANQVNARREAGIKPDRLLINLTISDDETETLDRTRLVLNEKASLGYELECDAAKFINSNAAAQIYMLEGNVKMAINERPANGDIRLGYMADKAGTLRISAPRMDLPMMLYDATTGLSYDLSLGAFEFQTEAGTFDKRFSLRFSDEATGIRNMTAKTGVAIGLQDGGLSIGGADGKDIDIYGTNGAQMARQTGNGFVSLPSGVYIVKVNGQSAKIHVK